MTIFLRQDELPPKQRNASERGLDKLYVKRWQKGILDQAAETAGFDKTSEYLWDLHVKRHTFEATH